MKRLPPRPSGTRLARTVSRKNAPNDLPWWIDLAVQYPAVMGVMGLVLAVAMVPLFLQAVRDYRTYAPGPSSMPFDAAKQSAESGNSPWVTLTDVSWDCRAQLQDGKVVLLRSRGGRMFVVEFAKGHSCESEAASPLRGVLEVASERRRGYLVEREGLRVDPRDEPLLLLCTYCGGDNARMGLIMGPSLMLLGLLLYPLFRNLRRRYYGF